LQSDTASYARALDRAHNLTSLLATRSESLPITSRAGNDRNASPGELDFMHGWTTNRHEGCVRTILTGSALSIAPPMRDFNGLATAKWVRKPTKTPRARLFVLTLQVFGLP